ncbi:MAG: hypothetical protein A2600_13680 [Candidatus Lambdaproteobacteria bacterium RIFOXYD1_FULL_56_27]|uniref:Uncharacterized protein n=1 Tax=Candidatus Lambdaproteobacteria bacterium RIFOXYD2_FULL_56_26 TaxID=1817773 RepID=A0A1F6GU80_9PROT|nr:MAG: hypothetical protein A2426_02275 [Candidatus Lambdaproteobacteria bacterium RIFOXYC1_FULL_56_13]OGH01551.1 MAG: hypothetical protein A2557_14055 [Candidatus Lambdaproteobacteria bacterium RIFOXYD2_FULL_56_26]OGH06772.1 MAG: hypothetical protein A2600_13680 [Candidatus Lambdaproteobacteria bacterium RIFOXYD1_FULL_56_27]
MDLLAELRLLQPLLAGELDLGLVTLLEGHPHLGPVFLAHYGKGPLASKLDSLAADHYHLFSLEVFPYGTVFFNENAHLGGPFAGHLAQLFAEVGLEAPSEPDHLGRLLSLVGFLVKENRKETLAEVLYLDLLSWYFPFVEAVKRLGHPFFNPVLDHLTSLLGSLRADVAPLKPEIPKPEIDPLALLEQEGTGFKQISEWLLAPAVCGVYLGRTEIKELGDQLEMPTGFGTRTMLLPQMFYTAVDYERLPELLAALEALFRSYLLSYQAQAPAWPFAFDYWISRTEIGLSLLERIKSGL